MVMATLPTAIIARIIVHRLSWLVHAITPLLPATEEAAQALAVVTVAVSMEVAVHVVQGRFSV
ncbi:hypothetical protein GCM10028773_06670 [Spirosoma koreense]